jgi:hypothetical protein
MRKTTTNYLKLKKILFLVIASSILIVSCKPKIQNIDPEKGLINPERIVMIGGNAIAGYTDDALSEDGQKFSVASLLAQQLQTIGSPVLVSPMVDFSSVGNNISGKSKMKLGYKTDCNGISSLSPIRIASSGDPSIFSTLYSATNPYTNLGVPNLKAIDINNSFFADTDPFFARITSSNTSSLLNNITALNPTFFTLMIGESDILDYALSGGTGVNLPASVNFESDVNLAVNTITSNGSRGVLTNIPDVTQYPYFTTIPWNGLTLSAEKAASLNTALAALNFGTYVEGANPFIINDSSSPSGFRWAKKGELVLLNVPLDSIKCFGMGSTSGGIPEKYILTLEEIATIKSTTLAYNSSLASIANNAGLAFSNINALFEKIAVGFPQNGVALSSKFVSGGVFSVDGLNLTPRGNALITNEIIKSINKTYNSTIRALDISAYRGVIFP